MTFHAGVDDKANCFAFHRSESEEAATPASVPTDFVGIKNTSGTKFIF
jgi:hypothetical protein